MPSNLLFHCIVSHSLCRPLHVCCRPVVELKTAICGHFVASFRGKSRPAMKNKVRLVGQSLLICPVVNLNCQFTHEWFEWLHALRSLDLSLTSRVTRLSVDTHLYLRVDSCEPASQYTLVSMSQQICHVFRKRCLGMRLPLFRSLFSGIRFVYVIT